MAHVITDECVLCELCAAVCSAGAIVRGADRFMVDAATCSDCGECLEVCPQECILAPAAFVEPSCPDL